MPAPPSLLNSMTYTSTSSSRLKALYSDFSKQKQSNLGSYEANIEWWKRTLECYVGDGIQGSDSLVLHGNAGLMENLRVEGVGRPIGLHAVMTELSTTNTYSPPPVIPLSTFLSSLNSIYASRSTLSYVTAVPSFVLSYGVAKPLWWALEQVGVVGEDSLASTVSSTFSRSSSASPSQDSWFGDYVLVGLLEKAGQNAMELQRNKAAGPGDALYSVEGFRREFAACISGRTLDEESSSMSELDMKVLLKYLARDKSAVVFNGEVVKFLEPYALSEQTREITAVDRGIVELKNAVANLQRQVSAIQTKMDQCTSKATEAIRQKRKPLALSYLRSRRQMEDVLNKRLGALENLEGTLVQVESAAGDIEIVKAYSTSTATLKAILSHPSLQRDTVEKTMEAMAEAKADAKELDDAIRIGGDVALGVEEAIDDDEIQNELDQLIKGSQADTEVSKLQEKLGGLSSVPSGQASSEREAERNQPQRRPTEQVLAA
ncbi:hypothetical protein PQX77_015078 [Marasmius sp. AFHP31]|nr:hypothetical protein PQX77_015078 [Marasmius sp. AFHP31]